jgi:hypothetical protein
MGHGFCTRPAIAATCIASNFALIRISFLLIGLVEREPGEIGLDLVVDAGLGQGRRGAFWKAKPLTSANGLCHAKTALCHLTHVTQ